MLLLRWLVVVAVVVDLLQRTAPSAVLQKQSRALPYSDSDTTTTSTTTSSTTTVQAFHIPTRPPSIRTSSTTIAITTTKSRFPLQQQQQQQQRLEIFLSAAVTTTHRNTMHDTDHMGNLIGATTTKALRTTKVRIVSYNLLSSHLANPQSYPTYPPQHLDPNIRLQLILQKLQQEIIPPSSKTTTTSSTLSSSSSLDHNPLPNDEIRPTIFCLQEVSYDWAGSLHTFFANHHYHVVTGLYGRPFNGYMGILTAYPIHHFDTVHVDICRLADTLPKPIPSSVVPSPPVSSSPPPPFASFASVFRRRLIEPVSNYMTRTFQYLQLLPPDVREPECHWNSAQRRYNVLLSVVLAEKNNDNDNNNPPRNQFVISNYHMPCVYYDEKVMVLHSDLCLARVQHIAQQPHYHSPLLPPRQVPPSDDNVVLEETPSPVRAVRRPYILAGDFNIKPNDTAYQLLTTGQISVQDPAYPTPPRRTNATTKKNGTTPPPFPNNDANDVAWKPLQQEPVRSAYAVHAFKDIHSNNSSTSHSETSTTTTTTTNDVTQHHHPSKPYHSSGTGEPDFTNFSKMGGVENPPFIDTLDYIFISPHHDENDPHNNHNSITVQDVLPLPHRDEMMVDGPYPNAVEPSDHVMIAANLDIVCSTTTTTTL